MTTSALSCISSLEPSSTPRRAESPNVEPNGRKPSGITGVGAPTKVHKTVEMVSYLSCRTLIQIIIIRTLGAAHSSSCRWKAIETPCSHDWHCGIALRGTGFITKASHVFSNDLSSGKQSTQCSSICSIDRAMGK